MERYDKYYVEYTRIQNWIIKWSKLAPTEQNDFNS